MSQASYLIEPNDLEALQNHENIVIVDLCKAKQYAQAHIPGAHFVNYIDIIKIDKPVMECPLIIFLYHQNEGL